MPSFCCEKKNMYYKRAKISDRKFREILHLFAMDLPATKTAEMTGINVRSINIRLGLRLQ